jgi:hypothetical protein
MRIRAGYRLAFDCPQPTAMLLVLNVHPSRRADLLSDDVPNFDPPLEMWGYTDGFGNACSRVVMPAGRTTVSTEFEIYDAGLPDVVPRDAVQHEIKDLPDESSCSCWAAAIATPIAWATSPGRPSARPRRDGAASRRSATSSTATSPSTTRTPTR